MSSKRVTFPSGRETTVYSVPQKYYDEIRAAFPDPAVPILESDKTATGEVMRYENRNDPDYKAACEEAARKRNAKWIDRLTLRGLRDVRPPEGWQVSEAQIDETRYFTEDAEWLPRVGEIGRALDYIEYEFFESPADLAFFMEVVNELSGIPEEAADAIEATFPGDVEVQGGGEGPARDTD